MAVESVPVPFVAIGNRRGFTGQQMMEDAMVRDFYHRFKHCFEPGPWNMDVVLFIEPPVEPM